jgi:YggT family protein
MRPPVPEVVVGLALVWLVKWALYLASLMVLVVAVLSWVNPFSPVLPVFDALTAPLLRPIRQILPNVGRFDLSPLVLFVIIQILEIILQGLAARWIGMY